MHTPQKTARIDEFTSYITGLNQEYVLHARKELDSLLRVNVSIEKGQQLLSDFNTMNHTSYVLPPETLMVLSLVDKIPHNADLHFLPEYKSDGILFRYHSRNSTRIMTKTELFSGAINDIKKGQILPDLDYELSKSSSYFLERLKTISMRMHDAIVEGVRVYEVKLLRTIPYKLRLNQEYSKEEKLFLKQFIAEIKQLREQYQKTGNHAKLPQFYDTIRKLIRSEKYAEFVEKHQLNTYDNVVTKRFIQTAHNLQNFSKVEPYIQENHLLNQISQPESLIKLLDKKQQDPSSHLVEAVSETDLYEKLDYNLKVALQMLYHDTVSEDYFADVEDIIFHTNVILLKKKSGVESLPVTKNVKDFFYNASGEALDYLHAFREDDASKKQYDTLFSGTFDAIVEDNVKAQNEGQRTTWKQFIYSLQERFNLQLQGKDHINCEMITIPQREMLSVFFEKFLHVFAKHIKDISITYPNPFFRGNELPTLDSKQSVIFDIKDRRKSFLEYIEKKMLWGAGKMNYFLTINDIKVFERYPNEYSVVLLERALGVIFFNKRSKNDIDEFRSLIPQKDIIAAKEYFKAANNVVKKDDEIMWSLFLKYSIKYLQGQSNVLSPELWKYFEGLFGQQRQLNQSE